MKKLFTSKESINEFCREYNKTPRGYTLGGTSFWNNIFELQGYVIQHHIWNTKHVRVLDEKNYRLASFGAFEDFYESLDNYENRLIAKQHRDDN